MFQTILLKRLGWLKLIPGNSDKAPVQYEYCGPKPAGPEDATAYMEACTEYSREGKRRRKKEREELLRKALLKESKVTSEVNQKDLDTEVRQALSKTGTSAIAALFKDRAALTLFPDQKTLYGVPPEVFIKALALMEKAAKYKVADPVAFAFECLEDSRI